MAKILPLLYLAILVVPGHSLAAHHQGEMHGGMGGSDDMMMMNRMQSHMDEMAELMQEIHGSRDSGKRNRLMREHMHMMQEGMGMMHNMMGGGMGMGGRQGGMMEGGDMEKGMQRGDQGMRPDCDPDNPMMQRRMNMMQMMMDQMMQHRDAMGSMHPDGE